MLTAALERRLLVERFGSGDPAVLALHGWGRGRQDWTEVCAGLDALAPDLPGFGLSPAPPDAWGAEQYADFVRPVLAEMDRPVLVGHSFGGRLGVHLAAAAGSDVRGLVLTGVPLVRPPGAARARPKLAFRVGRRLHRIGLIGPERMEALRQRYGSADYRAATGVMRRVLVRVVNESYEAQLPRIQCPVVLVWGEHDTVVPIDVARRAQALIPQATLRVVSGSGHLLDPGLIDRIRADVVDLLAR
jgi:pimeloyl-ACP methyl ester carboxylesterase